jgi:hypothetical protein
MKWAFPAPMMADFYHQHIIGIISTKQTAVKHHQQVLSSSSAKLG